MYMFWNIYFLWWRKWRNSILARIVSLPALNAIMANLISNCKAELCHVKVRENSESFLLFRDTFSFFVVEMVVSQKKVSVPLVKSTFLSYAIFARQRQIYITVYFPSHPFWWPHRSAPITQLTVQPFACWVNMSSAAFAEYFYNFWSKTCLGSPLESLHWRRF